MKKYLTMATLHHPHSASMAPCPQAGAGVHSWLLASANRCHLAGLSAAAAEALITGLMTRPPSPGNEVGVAVAKAYNTPYRPGALPSRYSAARAPVPLTSIRYDPDKLAKVAARITPPHNWRAWLWERSPKRPDMMTAWSYLLCLYEPGERIEVFDCLEDKKPLALVEITVPLDCRVPALIRSGGRHGKGIWYLCNPVDGQWHDTGERDKCGKPVMSCRNHQAVTAWRYAVLESDQASPDLWLAFIAQLPARISAIYTSGGRSVHTLIRHDAGSKAEWDSQIAPLKRPAKVLGVDTGCLSAVRLTRLPQCWRPEKHGFQKLLYLNPDPPLAPLVDMPVLWPRVEALTRWQAICPQWNRQAEAFQ